MQFIQKATKHKGALTKYAHSHGLTTKKGMIDLQKTEAYVKRNEKGKERTKRLREVNLARTLSRLRA